MMDDLKFTVGTEVMIRSPYAHQVIVTRVAKVYASGNIVLENNPKQQYKPLSGGEACPTGEVKARVGFYRHRNSAWILTDERRAEIEEDKLRDRLGEEARLILSQLRALPLAGLTEENVAALRATMFDIKATAHQTTLTMTNERKIF